ncbi:MAG: hypothetical protein KBD53_01725 [Candidatus Omnitrophica bacterium]|nr:hypothetical protein [Candidatus Omnitrophota bacterium]
MKSKIFFLTLVAVFSISHEALAESRMNRLTPDINDSQAVKSSSRQNAGSSDGIRNNLRDLNADRIDAAKDHNYRGWNKRKFNDKKFQKKIDRINKTRSLTSEEKAKRIKIIEDKRARAKDRFTSKHKEFRNNLRGDDRILPSGM